MIYLELLLTFLKIGAFTFGGGYAMLPLIQAEVKSHGWLDTAELVDFIAVSESTPGPFAVNISTFVGMRTAGIPGALCATFGVVLPSFLIIILVAKFYEKFRKSSIVQGCMTGLKPAVVGLIAAALVTTGQAVFFPAGISAGVFTTPAFLCSAGIFAAMLALSLKNLHPIVVILISAAPAAVRSGETFLHRVAVWVR